MPKEKYNNGTSEATEATGKDENATYSSENGAKTPLIIRIDESISEAVFYIYGSMKYGLFMSKKHLRRRGRLQIEFHEKTAAIRFMSFVI